MVKKLTKGLSVFLFLSFFVFLSSKVVAFASERPKGLEDRGPLTKITFIHYKKNFVKPDKPGRPGAKDLTCYGFLSKGVYWKDYNLPRTLHVNTASFNGLGGSFVLDAIDKSAEAWDSNTGTNLYSSSVSDDNANWDDSVPDYRSEIVKGYYPDSGVIAVTNVWGYFGGPPRTREIVDFDILFNSSFDWGDAGSNSSLMDLQNIATHEMGHGWGLSDMYQTDCSAVTMYGYSTEGETSKRTLETNDIKGLQKLYN